jgi:SNF2 family DNA or RNA helicase
MTLKTRLQQHQIKAIEKLSKIKIGALYMEMGTGKTRTALELISQRLTQGKVNHILWLCPCSVKRTIEKELEKHVDGNIPINIAGIESLSSRDRLYLKLLNIAQKKDVYLIIDESNLVKNHHAIRTKRIIELATSCKYKLILNGTPISKCEKDLYSQWYILDWRILGYKSFWSFANNHLEYDEKIKGRIRRVLNVDYLVRKIAPYTYQVKKSECLDLPKKTYSSRGFCMTREQEKHYDLIKDEYLFNVDELESSTIYKLFTACQHVISGRRVLTSAKEQMESVPMFNPEENPRIQKLMELIDKTEEKIIIWCKYTHEIKDIEYILKKEFGESSVVTFFGKVSKKNRIINADKFEKEARFFVANKTCAGYGLNLQFCSYMIYYSNDWDWATRSQSEDRVHRMGQTKNVHIVDLYAYNSLDSRILECLDRKERLVDSFKSWLEEMKDKDYKEIKDWIDGR